MMRRLLLVLLTLGTIPAVAPLQAQEPGAARPRLEELRRRVRERLGLRIQADLNLTDDQMGRLRATVATFGGRRREMEARQRVLREALAAQLRPGSAAAPDSVARLTDAVTALRVRYAESFGEEQAELARFLDPVQRARIMVLRERLLDRAHQAGGRRPFMDRRAAPE